MRSRRMLRITIILISILIAYLIYYSEYNIKVELSDIERGIEEFLEKDVIIVDFVDVDNTIFVYYTLGAKDSIGYTALYKGINFRYQIRNASYSTRNRVIHGEPFKTNKGNYLAIIGTNYAGKISKISIETTSGEKFSKDINGAREILMIFETQEESYLHEYKLYDKDGRDITDEMEKYITVKCNSSTSRSKAELFMLYVYCFMVVLIGYWISNMFKDKKTKGL